MYRYIRTPRNTTHVRHGASLRKWINTAESNKHQLPIPGTDYSPIHRTLWLFSSSQFVCLSLKFLEVSSNASIPQIALTSSLAATTCLLVQFPDNRILITIVHLLVASACVFLGLYIAYRLHKHIQ